MSLKKKYNTMTDRTALCSYLHLTSKIQFFEHFSTSVFSQTSRASIKQTTDTKLIWREVHNVDLNKHNMIETLTRRLLTTWHVSFLCGLFLTVKNTFPGGRLVPLSYRWLLSSSLSDCYTTSPSDETLSSPGRHSHSSKLHQKMVFISFF